MSKKPSDGVNLQEALQAAREAEAYIRRRWDLYEVMATSGGTSSSRLGVDWELIREG